MDYTVRRAARAIIVTPQADVLLMRMAFPWRNEDVWILPGGGIEDGESAEAALAREVYEETGARDLEVVGEAWQQQTWVGAMRTQLQQRYFYLRSPRYVPRATDLTEREMDWVREYRWWGLDALDRSPAAIEPIGLAAGIRILLERGLPPMPVEISA